MTDRQESLASDVDSKELFCDIGLEGSEIKQVKQNKGFMYFAILHETRKVLMILAK